MHAEFLVCLFLNLRTYMLVQTSAYASCVSFTGLSSAGQQELTQTFRPRSCVQLNMHVSAHTSFVLVIIVHSPLRDMIACASARSD
eukprot:3061517-Alexandrium_andersonii.AAC.1